VGAGEDWRFDGAVGVGAEHRTAAADQGLAMEYGLVSPYTAFLAVDATDRTAGNVGTSVNVPVPVPDGVKYQTTVQEGSEEGGSKKLIAVGFS